MPVHYVTFPHIVAVLLVVIVPQLVPLKYVSTTLGAHKSVSSTEVTITIPS